MSELENTVVNEPTDSTPVENDSVDNSTNNEVSPSPAEVDNTVSGDNENKIPHSRFNEVISEKNDLKKQLEELGHLKEFKSYDYETLKTLVGLNQTLNEHPDLAEQIDQALNNYFNKDKNSDIDAEDPVQAKINELQNKIQQMDSQVTQGIVEKNLQSYDKKFNELVSKDFQTEAEKRLALHFTGVALDMRDNKWSHKYDDKLMSDAYNEVKDLVSRYRNEIIEDYNKGKNNLSAPITNQGVNATTEVDVTNDEARHEYLVKQLNELVKQKNSII